MATFDPKKALRQSVESAKKNVSSSGGSRNTTVQQQAQQQSQPKSSNAWNPAEQVKQQIQGGSSRQSTTQKQTQTKTQTQPKQVQQTVRRATDTIKATVQNAPTVQQQASQQTGETKKQTTQQRTPQQQVQNKAQTAYQRIVTALNAKDAVRNAPVTQNAIDRGGQKVKQIAQYSAKTDDKTSNNKVNTLLRNTDEKIQNVISKAPKTDVTANNISEKMFGKSSAMKWLADTITGTQPDLSNYTPEEIELAKQKQAIREQAIRDNALRVLPGWVDPDSEEAKKYYGDWTDFLPKETDKSLLVRTGRDVGTGLMQAANSQKGLGQFFGDLFNAARTGQATPNITNADRSMHELEQVAMQNAFGRTEQNWYDQIVMNAASNILRNGMTGDVVGGLGLIDTIPGKAIGLGSLGGTSFGSAYGDMRYDDGASIASSALYGLATAGSELGQEAIPGGKIAGAERFNLNVNDALGEFNQEAVGALLDPFVETFRTNSPVDDPQAWANAMGNALRSYYTDENGNLSFGQAVNQAGRVLKEGGLAGLSSLAGGAATYAGDTARQFVTDSRVRAFSRELDNAVKEVQALLQNDAPQQQAQTQQAPVQVPQLDLSGAMARDADGYVLQYPEQSVEEAEMDRREALDSRAPHTTNEINREYIQKSGFDEEGKLKTAFDAYVNDMFGGNVNDDTAIGNGATESLKTMRKVLGEGGLMSTNAKDLKNAQLANAYVIKASAERHGVNVNDDLLNKITAISNRIGIPVEFLPSEVFNQYNADGWFARGTARHGLRTGVIQLRADSTDAVDDLVSTFLHEVMHTTEGTPEYFNLKRVLMEIDDANYNKSGEYIGKDVGFGEKLATDNRRRHGTEHLANLVGNFVDNIYQNEKSDTDRETYAEGILDILGKPGEDFDPLEFVKSVYDSVIKRSAVSSRDKAIKTVKKYLGRAMDASRYASEYQKLLYDSDGYIQLQRAINAVERGEIKSLSEYGYTNKNGKPLTVKEARRIIRENGEIPYNGVTEYETPYDLTDTGLRIGESGISDEYKQYMSGDEQTGWVGNVVPRDKADSNEGNPFLSGFWNLNPQDVETNPFGLTDNEMLRVAEAVEKNDGKVDRAFVKNMAEEFGLSKISKASNNQIMNIYRAVNGMEQVEENREPNPRLTRPEMIKYPQFEADAKELADGYAELSRRKNDEYDLNPKSQKEADELLDKLIRRYQEKDFYDIRDLQNEIAYRVRGKSKFERVGEDKGGNRYIINTKTNVFTGQTVNDFYQSALEDLYELRAQRNVLDGMTEIRLGLDPFQVEKVVRAVNANGGIADAQTRRDLIAKGLPLENATVNDLTRLYRYRKKLGAYGKELRFDGKKFKPGELQRAVKFLDNRIKTIEEITDGLRAPTAKKRAATLKKAGFNYIDKSKEYITKGVIDETYARWDDALDELYKIEQDDKMSPGQKKNASINLLKRRDDDKVYARIERTKDTSNNEETSAEDKAFDEAVEKDFYGNLPELKRKAAERRERSETRVAEKKIQEQEKELQKIAEDAMKEAEAEQRINWRNGKIDSDVNQNVIEETFFHSKKHSDIVFDKNSPLIYNRKTGQVYRRKDGTTPGKDSPEFMKVRGDKQEPNKLADRGVDIDRIDRTGENIEQLRKSARETLKASEEAYKANGPKLEDWKPEGDNVEEVKSGNKNKAWRVKKDNHLLDTVASVYAGLDDNETRLDKIAKVIEEMYGTTDVTAQALAKNLTDTKAKADTELYAVAAQEMANSPEKPSSHDAKWYAEKLGDAKARFFEEVQNAKNRRKEIAEFGETAQENLNKAIENYKDNQKKKEKSKARADARREENNKEAIAWGEERRANEEAEQTKQETPVVEEEVKEEAKPKAEKKKPTPKKAEVKQESKAETKEETKGKKTESKAKETKTEKKAVDETKVKKLQKVAEPDVKTLVETVKAKSTALSDSSRAALDEVLEDTSKSNGEFNSSYAETLYKLGASKEDANALAEQIISTNHANGTTMTSVRNQIENHSGLTEDDAKSVMTEIRRTYHKSIQNAQIQRQADAKVDKSAEAKTTEQTEKKAEEEKTKKRKERVKKKVDKVSETAKSVGKEFTAEQTKNITEATERAEEIKEEKIAKTQKKVTEQVNKKAAEQAKQTVSSKQQTEDVGTKRMEEIRKASNDRLNNATDFSEQQTASKQAKNLDIDEGIRARIDESEIIKPIKHDNAVEGDADKWIKDGGFGTAYAYAEAVAENNSPAVTEEEMVYMQKGAELGNQLAKDISSKIAEYENDKGRDHRKAISYLKDEQKRVTDQTVTILDAMYRAGSESGRALRAMRFMYNNPQLAPAYLQRKINQLSKEYAKDLAREKKTLKLNQELVDKYLDAKTDEERDKIWGQIEADIADQLPRNLPDMVKQWRMFCMLSNPRTHIKNLVANGLTYGLFRVDDTVQAGIENVLVNNKHFNSAFKKLTGQEFTRDNRQATAWGVDKTYLDVAIKLDEERHYSKETNGNKFDLFNGKREAGAFPNTIKAGKAINTASRVNMKEMEWVDRLFVQSRAHVAMAEILKARGYTVTKTDSGYSITRDNKPVTDRELARMEDAALKSAQEATFHDKSDVARIIENAKKKLGPVGFAIDVVDPFAKVSSNILSMAVQHTPLQLVNSATLDLYKVNKGEMSASTYVTRLSRGVTGLGLAALGAFLANAGILTKPDDEDEEGRVAYYDENVFGKQPIALHIPGTNKYLSIDWALPSAAPLMMGAHFAYNANKHGVNVLRGDTLGSLFTDSIKSLNPILEASYLTNLRDFIESLTQDNGKGAILNGASSIAESYLGQLLPIAVGTFNRVIDPKKRTISGNSFGERALNRALMNLPFQSFRLQPAVDEKGNEMENFDFGLGEVGLGAVGRLLYFGFSPVTITEDTHDELDSELMDIGAAALPRPQSGTGGLKGQIMKDLRESDQTLADLKPEEYTQVKKTYYGNYREYAKAYNELAEYNQLGSRVRDRVYANLEQLALNEAKATYYIGNTDDLYTDEQKVALSLKKLGVSPAQFYLMKDCGLSGNRKALYVMSELERLGVADEVVDDILHQKYFPSAVGLTDSIVVKTPDEREAAREKYLVDDGETLESKVAAYRAMSKEEYEAKKDKDAEESEKESWEEFFKKYDKKYGTHYADLLPKSDKDNGKTGKSGGKGKSGGSKRYSSKSKTTKEKAQKQYTPRTYSRKGRSSGGGGGGSSTPDDQALFDMFMRMASSGLTGKSSSKIKASIDMSNDAQLWDSIVNGSKKDVEKLRKELKL